MTTTDRHGYDPRELPDQYDRPDSQFQVAEHLRGYYRRTPDLDRDRAAAVRAIRREPFQIPDHLWPPGGGIPPAVQPAASAGRDAAETLAHYAALKAADDEFRAEAAGRQADADRKARTCSCCGTPDPSTRPRGGGPGVLDVVAFGGWRLCERCATVIRRQWRARLEDQAALLADEETPAGRRAAACASWLASVLGEDG